MVDVKTGVHNVLNYLVRCSIIEHVLFNSRNQSLASLLLKYIHVYLRRTSTTKHVYLNNASTTNHVYLKNRSTTNRVYVRCSIIEHVLFNSRNQSLVVNLNHAYLIKSLFYYADTKVVGWWDRKVPVTCT
jgi:hypothetical protein